MSYFDDASLVMIPSGYKTSKVYSVKPTSGNGDLTFTRSNDTATRVGPDGLIEKVRTNLLTYSQDLTNAVWSKFTYSGGAVTVTGSQSDPFGGTNAQKFDITIGTGGVLITQNITVDATAQYGLSIWLKGAVGGEKVEFDLRDTASNGVAGPVQTLTTTWTRYTITLTNNGGTSRGLQFRITTVQGASDCTFFAYGAQLEAGVPTDYIPTTSAAVSVGPVSGLPRLDYLNSSCPRLLLEPQRTNLTLYSEQFNNAAWTKNELTVTANNLVSPDGYTNADTALETSSNAFHDLLQTISVTSGTTYTLSSFVKAAGRDYCYLFISDGTTPAAVKYNLSTGVVLGTALGSPVSSKIENYGNGWYRCSMTYTAGATVSGTIAVSATNSPALSLSAYTGDVTKGIAVYGAQLESGAYATSYIPTLGASVTRGADAASKTSASALIGQTEGTVYWEGYSENNASFGTCLTLQGSAGYWIYILSYGGGFTFEIRNNYVASMSYNSTSAAGNYKIAIGYNASQVVIYINGTLVHTDNSVTIPATSSVYLANWENVYNQSVKTGQALLFKTRLSNADLAALTA